MNLATLERPRATIRLENQIADLVSQNAKGNARASILLKVAIDMLPPHNAKREVLEKIAEFERCYFPHGLRDPDMTEDEVAEIGSQLFHAIAEFMRYHGHYEAQEWFGI